MSLKARLDVKKIAVPRASHAWLKHRATSSEFRGINIRFRPQRVVLVIPTTDTQNYPGSKNRYAQLSGYETDTYLSDPLKIR